MTRSSFKKNLWRALHRYLTFFILVAFVITCCMTLFVSTLSGYLDVELTDENMGDAAKATFWNVILLSFLFTVIDALRRKYTLDRTVKQVAMAAQRMIHGDFSVRIPPVSRYLADDYLHEIITCVNQMAEELAGVETLRADFIANVSHEMKTPLAVIQNYGTLLQSPNLSDDKRLEYAHAVSDASHRLSDMITNILKLNRLENQQIYPRTEQYNLSEQLCTCLLAYEEIWEARGIEPVVSIEDDVMIAADAELLQLVWNNLLSNAFKFTDMGGTVTLTLTTKGKWAVVSVKDSGCGMSPEIGAHIFEKFYQGDTSHATQGNGLGLALVKRVMDILHGEISVESTLGVGSTFTVKIGMHGTDDI